MKAFTCNDFVGFYPTGTAAVIIAADEEQAQRLLSDALDKLELPIARFTIKPLDLSQPGAVILANGDY